MKVLSIGNALTCDIHQYLPELTKAAGRELLLSALYIEDACIEDHYRNYEDENDDYIYSTFLPGETAAMSPDGIALHEAVEDDDWDIITFEQNVALSGLKESYRPYLAELTAYCRLMHPNVKLMLIEPWAYESGCSDKSFQENYDSDQSEMYKKINECCIKAADEAETDGIIPIGRAWQITRSTDIGDRLTKDGSHANELGQFLSSCCLYKAVFGEDSFKVPFDLPEYDRRISDLLKLCADSAF